MSFLPMPKTGIFFKVQLMLLTRCNFFEERRQRCPTVGTLFLSLQLKTDRFCYDLPTECVGQQVRKKG